MRIAIIQMLFILCMVSMFGCGKKKEEEYRQIQVYKIDGTVTVERQGSSMEAYHNMQLQSGDSITTVADSYVQLKLDEDKYILVEPESQISLQATGNSVDSKTSIELVKGAIVNQLDNPLSEDSSYEVTTPNSTMAVRGTTFRVELTVDEKGETYAKVAVYGGKVECNLVFPDGTITEPVMIEAGMEVLVWGDDVESEYVGTNHISYEELREIVIDFLGDIIDRGEELSITKEQIAELQEGLADLEEEKMEEEEPLPEIPTVQETVPDNSDEPKIPSLQKVENTETTSTEIPVVQQTLSQTTPTNNNNADDDEEDYYVDNSGDDSSKDDNDEESSSDEGNNGNTGDSGSDTGDVGGDSSNDNNAGNGDSSEPEVKPEPEPEPETRMITIRFWIHVEEPDANTVKEVLYAYKELEVKDGVTEVSVEEIGTPLLQPDPNGIWYVYDGAEEKVDYRGHSSLSITDDAVDLYWSKVE